MSTSFILFYSRATNFCSEKQCDNNDDDMSMHGYLLKLWPSDERQFHAKVSRCGKGMHNMAKQRNKRKVDNNMLRTEGAVSLSLDRLLAGPSLCLTWPTSGHETSRPSSDMYEWAVCIHQSSSSHYTICGTKNRTIKCEIMILKITLKSCSVHIHLHTWYCTRRCTMIHFQQDNKNITPILKKHTHTQHASQWK